MERLIERRLVDWKNSSDRKPLILLGVRHCGKTFVLKEFGRRHFKSMAYFDFESDPELRRVFGIWTHIVLWRNCHASPVSISTMTL